jgi:hypothetical protein
VPTCASSPRVSWSSGRHASGSVSARCRDSRDHVCVALRGPPLLQLSKEISEFDEHLGRLVAEAAPELIAVEGVGTDTTASLLIAAGDNPERLSSKAAFAHLCGVTPIPASFGKIVRPRLHRGATATLEQSPLLDRFQPHEPRRTHPGLRGPPYSLG